MWVLIDDVRDLNCDIIARDGQAGIKVLEAFKDEIEVLILDHDLGDSIDGTYICNYMLDHKIFPPRIQLVTMNPVGRANMETILKSAGYNRKGNFYVYD